MKHRDIQLAIIEEVKHWPGVSVHFINATGNGHPKAVLNFNGKEKKRAFVGSSSDSIRATKHTISDMRKAMKFMGAVRAKAEPADVS